MIGDELATAVSAGGAVAFLAQAAWYGGFHLFTFTLAVAGALVASLLHSRSVAL